MKKNILLSLAACISLSTTLFADTYYDTSTPAAYHPIPPRISYPYVGGAFSLTQVKDDYIDFIYTMDSESTEIDYNSMMFQAGYQYNSYLAMEFRYWFSMNSGEYTTNSIYSSSSAYESFDAWGMYLKPMYPLSSEFSIYGLLGFSSVHVDGVFPGSEILYNEGDFSWGVGTSFDINQNLALFFDYVSLFDDRFDTYNTIQDTKVNTLNFGVTYKF